MKSFSFRRFCELLVLLGAGAVLGIVLDRGLRPRPPAVAAEPAPPPAPAAKPAVLTCALRAAFTENVYPSLLLSFASADPEYERWFTVSVDGATPGRTYRIEIDSSLFQSPALASVTATAGHFEVQPDLPWNFAALRGVDQLQPETVVATVADQDDSAQASLACTVHPVNEVVSRLYDADTGAWVDMSICFAAFVNEDHPWIGRILQEAAAKDDVAHFSGYEFGPESVVRQMAAIWDALAARGLTYVDIATTSGGTPGVETQYVRFLDQSLRDQGANCVDASVLFASIFRRIGLRPVLLFRPGHCLVAVYDSEQGGHLIGIETTLLGTAPFGEAFKVGSEEVAGLLPNLQLPGYSLVDIAAARAVGVRPIEYDDGR
ncbi:MAG: hypothetical protein ACREFX_00015 [Opitutaceae bacterium]